MLMPLDSSPELVFCVKLVFRTFGRCYDIHPLILSSTHNEIPFVVFIEFILHSGSIQIKVIQVDQSKCLCFLT